MIYHKRLCGAGYIFNDDRDFPRNVFFLNMNVLILHGFALFIFYYSLFVRM